MQLRENQVVPVQVAIDFFKEKNPLPSLIVLPTAWGKSILLAKVAEAMKEDEKLLILQPSKELLEQNYNKFTAIGGKASIYSASFNSKEIGNVTYATIGSIKNIGTTFKELGFTKLAIDEAHLFPRKDESMFGKFRRESGINHILGVTATPLKLQSYSLGYGNGSYSVLKMLTSTSTKAGNSNLFKDILHVSQIQEMVALKYWSPMEYEVYSFDTGKLVYNSTMADFTDDSIKKAYVDQNIEGKIIKKLGETDRKHILVFVPSIQEAIALSDKVPNSAAVFSGMPDRERRQIIEEFREGKIRVVFNVNILSTGFDYPEIDCIIMGRPSASLAWYYQVLGRGTRIHIDKKDCLVVDFSGNVEKFGKIQDFYFKKEKKSWKMFGEGGKTLTGIPMHEIGEHYEVGTKVIVTFGKYAGREVKNIPQHWWDWALENITWKDKNKHVKEEILRLKSLNL
jgi:DNA repair protein RadD